MARTKQPDFFSKHSIKESAVEHPDHSLEMEPYKERDNLDGLRGKSPSVSLNKSVTSRYSGITSRAGNVYAPGADLARAAYNRALLSLPGLTGLYDSRQITGFAHQSFITQWDDLSGAGHHLVKNAAASLPLYNQAGPSVYFYGETDANVSLKSAGFVWGQPATIFIAVRGRDAINISGNPWQSIIAGTGANCLLRYTFASIPTGALRLESASVISGSVDRRGSYHVIECILNGASSSILVDGNLDATGTIGIGNATDLFVGSINGQPLMGEMKMLVISSQVLSADVRGYTRKYIGDVCGIPVV